MLVVEGGEQAETPHLLLELAVLVVGLLDQVELIQHQMQLTLLVVVVEVLEPYHMVLCLEIRLGEQVVPES
jgi:hypothetical protein